jgi:cytochrome P450
MTTTPASIESDIDLFSDEALTDPYPLYKQLQELGPATYLTKHDVWFLSRYEEVRAALLDAKTFSSRQGVGLNPAINEAWANAIISMDPPEHTPVKKLMMDRLGPRQIQRASEEIDERADKLVEQIVARGSIDGVADVAYALPVNVIMDLVGWPENERDNLLEFAAGSFDCVGPMGERVQAALPKLASTVEYVTEIYESNRMAPGSFGDSVTQAARDEKITKDAAIGLLLAYVTAALDTTINGVASGMWLFAHHPDQWDIVRSDPSLIRSAFNEILRMESPVQFFSRVTTREVDRGDGVVLPEGARVLHSYGAANRDGRQYPDPDRFDVTRNPLTHLAFGVGAHACVGQSLARLEADAVFNALARRVRTIEPAGEPTRALNNVTRGFASVPLRVS